MRNLGFSILLLTLSAPALSVVSTGDDIRRDAEKEAQKACEMSIAVQQDPLKANCSLPTTKKTIASFTAFQPTVKILGKDTNRYMEACVRIAQSSALAKAKAQRIQEKSDATGKQIKDDVRDLTVSGQTNALEKIKASYAKLAQSSMDSSLGLQQLLAEQKQNLKALYLLEKDVKKKVGAVHDDVEKNRLPNWDKTHVCFQARDKVMALGGPLASEFKKLRESITAQSKALHKAATEHGQASIDAKHNADAVKAPGSMGSVGVDNDYGKDKNKWGVAQPIVDKAKAQKRTDDIKAEAERVRQAQLNPKGPEAKQYMGDLQSWAQQNNVGPLPANCFTGVYGRCSNYVASLRQLQVSDNQELYQNSLSQVGSVKAEAVTFALPER